MHRWVFNLYYSLFSFELSSPWGWGYFTFNKHCLTQCPGLFGQRKRWVLEKKRSDFSLSSIKLLFV